MILNHMNRLIEILRTFLINIYDDIEQKKYIEEDFTNLFIEYNDYQNEFTGTIDQLDSKEIPFLLNSISTLLNIKLKKSEQPLLQNIILDDNFFEDIKTNRNEINFEENNKKIYKLENINDKIKKDIFKVVKRVDILKEKKIIKFKTNKILNNIPYIKNIKLINNKRQRSNKNINKKEKNNIYIKKEEKNYN